MKHLFIAAAVLLLSGVVSYLEQSLKLFTITILAGYLWLFLGFVYYQVESFKYLTAHKLLDGQVRFTSEASAGQVLGIIVLGLIVITILFFIVGFFLSFRLVLLWLSRVLQASDCSGLWLLAILRSLCLSAQS